MLLVKPQPEIRSERDSKVLNLPLQDLNGPHRADAEAIIRHAFDLNQERAVALEQSWDGFPGRDDQLSYLLYCKIVWDALEESGRFLPLGWFEAIFADCSWVETTRALHPVADAVCATLVRDLVPDEAYHHLAEPLLALSRR